MIRYMIRRFFIVGLILAAGCAGGWYGKQFYYANFAKNFFDQFEDAPKLPPGFVDPDPMVQIKQSQYNELAQDKADLDKMRSLMQQWQQNGRLPSMQGVVYVEVKTVDNADPWSSRFAVQLRNQLAKSGRYMVTDTVTPRIVISILGGGFFTRGESDVMGAYFVTYTCSNGFTPLPQELASRIVPWMSKSYRPQQYADDVISTLDESVADIRKESY